MTDYSLWEVILNGNKVLKRTVGETEQEYEPTTAEEKQDISNKMKARGTLLMALPNKDQLKFHSYKDAKLLMKAIEKRYFEGNKESRKLEKLTQATHLRNLSMIQAQKNGSNLLTDSCFNLEEQRGDKDHYTNSNCNSSTIEADNTAHGVSAAHTQCNSTSGDNLSDAMICAFLASQPNSPQLGGGGGWGRVGFDKTKVECYNCHKYGHFARECRAPRNQENRGRENNRRTVTVETPTENALVAHDGIGGYEWSYLAEEAHPTNFALMAHKSSGSSFSSDSEVDSCSKSCVKAYATLKEQYDSLYLDYKRSQFNLVSYKAVKLRDTTLVENKKKLEKAEKERDELKLTLEKFQNSSKSLNNLLESQVIDKFKTGLGYNVAFSTASSPIVESFGTSFPITIVTPSNGKKVELNHESADVKNNGDAVEPKTVRKNSFRPPVIKDWNSDDDSEGNPQQKEYKEKEVIDSGCSRHMTGNKCCLTEYEDYDDGFVSFGDGKGRIYGKGQIKTGTLDFDNVYFCKELKYNLFSVSQICDKKNNVLFTNTECLVLSSDFKLLDESQVLLRVPRKDNIYSVDLKSVGIKREFSVARTPQQNGVAERRNRTLIEAARTMVLVIKPYSKTPYELIHGRTPLIDFMKPFGCPVTILNTSDHLGKFDGKANEGFFCCVLCGNGPDWLFDVDSLTISMNYVPVVAGNQTNGIAGTRDNIVTGQAEKKTEPEQEYILIPICTTDPLISQGPKDSEEDSGMKPTEVDESGASDKDGEDDQATRSEFERLLQQEKQTVHPNSTNSINTVSTPVSAAGPSFTNDDPSSPVNAAEASNAFEEHLFEIFSPFKNAFTLPPVLNVTLMDDTGIFGNSYNDEDVGAEADLNNLEKTMNVSPIPTTRIDKDHPKDQIIGDFNSAIQTRRMTKISDEHAMVWTLVNLPNGKKAIGIKWVFRNKKDERGIVVRNKARLVAQGYTQEEGIDYDEVLAPVARIEKKLYMVYIKLLEPGMRPLFTYLIENGFRRDTIDKTLFIKKDKGDILLVHVYVDDIIFGSTKKSLCDEFEGLMHNRFQTSYIGELTFFLGLQVQQKKDGIFISQDKYVADILKKFDFATVKTLSTPTEPNKELVKDEEADSVDVHLYRSMIGSLMYLIASRPDIMIVVCACAWFQVTPKRDSPFDLEAFSDSDYARASLDRKSTIEGCQFLGKRFISWKCKKQTTVANSTTEEEYVAAANCRGQNLVFHSKTKHIEIRHHFIRDCYEKKLIQVIKIHTDHNVADLLTKAFDVSRMERAATTASSLDAEQDSDAQTRFETTFKKSNDPPLSRGSTLGGGEDSMKLLELMELCTKLSDLFWATAKEKTVNGERQLQGLVDKKKVIVTKTSIRSDLHLEDVGGIDCLPTATIFEELARMGSKTTAWNEFSSTMASAIICLATNQKFNLFKYIFDAMEEAKKTTIVPHLSDSTADVSNEESVHTHSSDLLLSSEDRLKLTNLMDMCTKLSERVLDLEHTKTAQAQEITNLKLSVKKLEKKAGLRTYKFKRLYKGRSDDAEMSDTYALIEVSTAAPSTTAVSPPILTEVEITLAQTLAKLKSAKSKVVIQEPVHSTATKTPLTIPKAKGITFRDAGESTTRTPTSVSSSSIKDKGKAKMDEPEVPLKKKDQIALDEEMARNVEAQIQAELIEEERLARKKEEEANITLIESWDNTQAMMEADFELAQRLQAEEHGEITIEERSRLKKDELESDKSKKAESSVKKAKGSIKKSIGKKRAGKEQKQESFKRQRMEDDKETDEHEEAEEDDEAGMKKHIEEV
ncbi:putative ribonuclease H-like domain-containing protein [Tanacetum coccineum]